MTLVRIWLCVMLKVVSKHEEADGRDMYWGMIAMVRILRWRWMEPGHAHVLNRQRVLPNVTRPLSIGMVMMCRCSKTGLTGIIDTLGDIIRGSRR